MPSPLGSGIAKGSCPSRGAWEVFAGPLGSCRTPGEDTRTKRGCSAGGCSRAARSSVDVSVPRCGDSRVSPIHPGVQADPTALQQAQGQEEEAGSKSWCLHPSAHSSQRCFPSPKWGSGGPFGVTSLQPSPERGRCSRQDEQYLLRWCKPCKGTSRRCRAPRSTRCRRGGNPGGPSSSLCPRGTRSPGPRPGCWGSPGAPVSPAGREREQGMGEGTQGWREG